MAHVHNDLAGPLHNVGVVEGLALDPSRSGLGDSVIFRPLPTHTRRASRLWPFAIVRPTGRVASLARSSVGRSFYVGKEMRVTKLIQK